MQYKRLGRTGWQVSAMGLGGAALGDEFGAISPAQAADTVAAARDAGINFFDTAAQYGLGESERRMGAALKPYRRDVILATKAVMRGTPYDYTTTMKSVHDSLTRLQTDYIDLIQLHEAETTSFDVAIDGCLRAFADLKKAGVVRAIGVNGRDIATLLPYIESGLIDTTLVFCRYMLIDTTIVDALIPATRHHDVAIINGSPLGMGLLTDVPAPFLRDDTALLAEVARRKMHIAHLARPGANGFVEPALRYSLTHPDIAVTLTGAAHPDVLRANLAFCDGTGPSVAERRHTEALFAGQKLFS
jgi:L-galactose dehydrogenase